MRNRLPSPQSKQTLPCGFRIAGWGDQAEARRGSALNCDCQDALLAYGFNRGKTELRQSLREPYLIEQTEDCDPGLRWNVDPPGSDHWIDEVIDRSKVVAGTGLIAVIEFLGQVFGIEGIQNCRAGMTQRPHDSIRSPTGRDRRRRAGKSEGSCGLAEGVVTSIAFEMVKALR